MWAQVVLRQTGTSHLRFCLELNKRRDNYKVRNLLISEEYAILKQFNSSLHTSALYPDQFQCLIRIWNLARKRQGHVQDSAQGTTALGRSAEFSLSAAHLIFISWDANFLHFCIAVSTYSILLRRLVFSNNELGASHPYSYYRWSSRIRIYRCHVTKTQWSRTLGFGIWTDYRRQVV